MCMFSQAVRSVAKTRIFARPVDATRQLLVYAMSVDADAELAMVLPVPVPPSSGEGAVRFVDMSSCPTFFTQLATLFPAEETLAFRGGPVPRPAPQSRLVVHAVGDFDASFVPSMADFGRLDARFRLAPSVWDALPDYADWGFCVFKLRGSGATPAEPRRAGFFDGVRRLFAGDVAHQHPPAPAGARAIHPMAFEFPRRDGAALFFPTVHVHDGAIHPTAHFDHTLYCQLQGGAPANTNGRTWERSAVTVRQANGALLPTAGAWLDDGAHVHRLQLDGDLPNRDVRVVVA